MTDALFMFMVQLRIGDKKSAEVQESKPSGTSYDADLTAWA